MRVGSLFSGAGGMDYGFHAAGFEAAWFCEIDPTARAVLARHWPEVPCYEDIRTLDPVTLPRVDVLIGGFPCQDVSVAGNRAGLAGERTGLFWEFARLVDGLRPTWLCLENVPGLLSSNDTEDMGAVLWALGELGYGWAYRVLDAQHWGVPQRRRRVFIVGRTGADTPRAAQVLFESDRGAGDSPAGGQAGEELAYCLAASAGSSSSRVGQGWNTTYIADTVRSHPRPGSNSVGNLAFHPTQDPISGEVSPALGHDGMAVLELAATLRSRNHAPGVNAPGRGGEDDQNLVVANSVQASAGHHGHSSPRGDGNDNLVVAATLQARAGKGLNGHWSGREQDDTVVCPTASTVRRLMPIECERLQGWPDGWTEGHADGPRYRLIGNGVAAPVAEWIARRIAKADRD